MCAIEIRKFPSSKERKWGPLPTGARPRIPNAIRCSFLSYGAAAARPLQLVGQLRVPGSGVIALNSSAGLHSGAVTLLVFFAAAARAGLISADGWQLLSGSLCGGAGLVLANERRRFCLATGVDHETCDA